MNTTQDACKLSMLWNWDTVDSCFISEQWHVHTLRQYAGTLIGVFFIVVLLEAFRKISRAYDAHILRRYKNRLAAETLVRLAEAVKRNKPFSPGFFQHLVRSLFYFIQFSTAYLLMLAAMTHNGGLLIAIFAGAFAGFFLFGRDTVPGATVVESSDYAIHLEQLGFNKDGSRA
ncbi:Ctr copper transporter family-domain-containing protein [Mycena maculata]|uniref:Copper transport protein n=1 Tax=Mycena maculata TaxID=230809 RepID=A0AAD7MFS6_9AGAR|nr:Ctr copper transporter family-domain-containing protein [Mycena maculata]